MLTSSRRQFLHCALGTAAAAVASQVSAEIPLPLSLGGGPLPVFQNGFLVVLDSGLTSVSLVDMRGGIASTFSPRLPDAAVQRVVSVAVSKEKQLAVALAGKDNTGRFSFFLAMANLTGQVTKVVQMPAFALGSALFLPDGRLFCLGREFDASDPRFPEVPGHQVARFFTSDGVLAGKALPVREITTPASSHPVNWVPVPGTGKIGLLDRENRLYSEIDTAGKIIRPLSKLGVEEPALVTGIVLLPNGDRLVTLDIPRTANGRLHYGSQCGVVQISDAAGGGLSVRTRSDLLPDGPASSVLAVGSHEGKPVFLARQPDRLLIPSGT